MRVIKPLYPRENVYAIKKGLEGKKIKVTRNDPKNGMVCVNAKIIKTYPYIAIAEVRLKNGNKIAYAIPYSDIYAFLIYQVEILV